MYRFKISHNPGRWHRRPDALSRNPVKGSSIHALFLSRDEVEPHTEDPMGAHIRVIMQNAGQRSLIASVEESDKLITEEELEQAASNDPEYQRLIQVVNSGFPLVRGGPTEEYRAYWEVCDRLSMHNKIVIMDSRIVIPKSYRARILKNLHSAHQGVTSMLARARSTIYWPGLEKEIRNTRFNCQKCSEWAPLQTKEPLQASIEPLYPYQKICCDYFELLHHAYLSIADRYSGWVSIYLFPITATS